MRTAILLALSGLGLAGCANQVDTSPPMPVASDQVPAPDNTATNRRDADMSVTKTPIDQDEDQADVNTTAEIRKRVMDTPDMSLNAQNAKIITAEGKVTLRGPVDSAAEKETIERIAREVAGEGKVDSQLEVTTKIR
jgi:osmotically-inducible protein OsmY